jgi:hypothetical protein
MEAIIGNRGLVGKNLCKQHEFQHQFNTSNMPRYYDGTYSTVVCSAAPASMLLAKRDPVSDGEVIDHLIEQLSLLCCDQFVLISSIAVLAGTIAPNEDTFDFEMNSVYGINRRRLEVYCAQRFDKCLIVRLPALFGEGLKKNFIYDMLNPVPSFLTTASCNAIKDLLPHNLLSDFLEALEWVSGVSMYKVDRRKINTMPNKLELEHLLIDSGFSSLRFTNPESKFQFYNLNRLWADIEVGLSADLKVLHISTAPLKVDEIYNVVTNKVMPRHASDAAKQEQNMRTCHGHLWGSNNAYIIQENEMLEEIVSFYNSY